MSVKDSVKDVLLDEARVALAQLSVEAIKALLGWLYDALSSEPDPAEYVARKLQADAAHAAQRVALAAALAPHTQPKR